VAQDLRRASKLAGAQLFDTLLVNNYDYELDVSPTITPLMRQRLRDLARHEEIDGITALEAAALIQYFDGYKGCVS